MQRIAVGWSHETWLFDATWTIDGVDRRPGLLPAARPGQRAAARDVRPRHPVRGAARARADRRCRRRRPYFYEADPAVLGAPFLVMEKVPGVCPSPWGRDGRRFYRGRRRARRAARRASPTRSSRSTPPTGGPPASSLLGVPGAGRGLRPPRDRQVAGADRRVRRRAGPGARPTCSCWLEANAPRTDRRVARPRRLPHRQPADRRRPGVGGARLGDRGDRRPDVRRRLRAVGAQPGGHRPAVEPRRARRLPPALRGGHRHRDRRRARAATTRCSTPCARRRSG